MSPQTNDTPGLSLPQPSLDSQVTAPAPLQAPASVVPAFQPPVVQVPTPQTHQQFVSMPQDLALVPQNSVAAQLSPQQTLASANDPSQSVQSEAPDEGDDALDAEWVAKAKAVADQNRLDPFVASNALSQLKADYMQQRYGKTIKVNNRT